MRKNEDELRTTTNTDQGS